MIDQMDSSRRPLISVMEGSSPTRSGRSPRRIDVAVAGSAVFNQPDYAGRLGLKAAFGSAPA